MAVEYKGKNYLVVEKGEKISVTLADVGDAVSFAFHFGSMSVAQKLNGTEVAALIVWLKQWELQQDAPEAQP